MADVKWIKLSTDIFDNRKIKLIESMPEGDALVVIWLKLLVLAGVVNEKGCIYLTKDIPYTDELLATLFNRPITTIRLALQVFEQFEMIEIVNDIIMVSNWEKYQNEESMEKIREQNRIRQANYRARQKALLTDNATVTLQVTLDNAIDKDIDIEKDKDKEKDNIPPYNPPKGITDEAFDEFWKAYPKKVGKADARKAFAKAIKIADLDTMLQAIEAQKESDQWSRDNGKYIPNPSTWLNQGRWDDELAPKGVTTRNGRSVRDDDFWLRAAQGDLGI